MGYPFASQAESQELREIGRIVLLQVAPCSLKRGAYPDEDYYPELLVSVEALLLSAAGAVGLTSDGEQVIDVHHTGHPAARRWGKDNGISLGFTSHYAAMRAYFGPHLATGCAAENVIIATEGACTLADLAGGVLIGAGVQLGRALVATPCVPFARWAARNPALAGTQMRDALRFLNHGRRGFYMALAAPLPHATLRVGDPVYALRLQPASALVQA